MVDNRSAPDEWGAFSLRRPLIHKGGLLSLNVLKQPRDAESLSSVFLGDPARHIISHRLIARLWLRAFVLQNFLLRVRLPE
jgi:hypothetical protein